MAYDNPNRIPYRFPYDFGSAADETFAIRGPKGKAGRLWDYGIDGVTEVFNGSSVKPQLAIGSASDPDAYGEEFDLNAVADNDAKSVRSTYDEIADKTAFDALMVNRTIPKDTKVLLTCTGATGSPTGQACAFVIIDWAD